MIIGLTGKNGAGKGEVAAVLKENGFIYFSLSDVLRDELTNRKEAVLRENLIKIGNELRKLGGPGVLAEKTMAKLDSDKNYVIDSIRNPEEVRVLRREPTFKLFHITALPAARFERIKTRAREGDPTTLEAFKSLEQREAANADPNAQQLDLVAKMRDVEIENNGTLEELREKVRPLVLTLLKAQPRPTWDEYFMEIARTVAMRSNCLKRKVAAVLVKDKRIISTGYNGTPRGITNCNEGGCPRCHSFSGSGKNLDECVCSHAEENAITQSAYHGVAIKDASIYTTFSPCLTCTKMIINSGIIEVIYNANYPLGEKSVELLKEAKISVRQI
ncbi:MAG: AAA family ATPase [Deltaproteobacteria bacterium]|nr:AAA family ATPase [Deltaproteobacteria bacterium]